MAKAADLMRGAIDQADFKAYMFPLMFFKRISDVYRSSTCTPATGASATTTASR
jgi:type I restriction-modification system DNA methylase subunit